MKFFENGASEAKKASPWLLLGVPLGCGIGIAIRHIALGVGVGLLIGAIIMVFQTKKEERKIRPVVLAALIVASAVMLVLAFVAKK